MNYLNAALIVLLAFLLIGCSSIRKAAAVSVVAQGTSMLPGIQDGEQLWVKPISAESRLELHRGDLIVAHDPEYGTRSYVRRLIGLPGDTIEVRVGDVWINGNKLSEPYIDQQRFNVSKRSMAAVKIATGTYFVMADNRDNAGDSRIWGAIKASSVTGVVMERP
ncbi:MAG TPA: signal peptidase I [Pyrinomonadaceae bacterium]|nr:signal peptidase I [Pyrinomonadaceae bacterium]